MSMIKDALAYLVGLKANKIYEIDGRTYSDQALELIEEPRYKHKVLTVYGLDSICKLIREERFEIGKMIYVQVVDHKTVDVLTTFDDRKVREYLYTCRADVPNVTVNSYMPYETAIIQLRSLYIPGDGTDYLLELLSSIKDQTNVKTSDNGVTQKVEARTGIALAEMVTVRPRVLLSPFRTFLEVDQPDSEFLIRVSDGGNVGLFEADGGVWKLEAKRNIAGYFENALEDLIAAGYVTVIR